MRTIVSPLRWASASRMLPAANDVPILRYGERYSRRRSSADHCRYARAPMIPVTSTTTFAARMPAQAPRRPAIGKPTSTPASVRTWRARSPRPQRAARFSPRKSEKQMLPIVRQNTAAAISVTAMRSISPASAATIAKSDSPARSPVDPRSASRLVTSFRRPALSPAALSCGTTRVISETAPRPLSIPNHIATDVSSAYLPKPRAPSAAARAARRASR